MNKILLYNFSLSVWFAGKKRNLFEKGTWFLFSYELFFITPSIVMFLLSLIEIRLSEWMLLLLLIFFWIIIFYGIRGWFMAQLKIRRIEEKYRTIEKLWLYRLIGLLLYFGSPCFFIFSSILFFDEYLKRP